MVTKAVAKKTEANVEALDWDDIRQNLWPKLNEKEAAIARGIANSFDLNPYKREIHAIKYGDSPVTIVVGYEVYLKRANATGRLNGWDVQLGPDGKSATITIHRKDWDQPFQWTVYRQEHDTGKGPWRTMPSFMLRKVAIGQGFRLCFPEELGGLPYLPEELPQTSDNSASINTAAPDTNTVQTAEVVEAEPVEKPKTTRKRTAAEAVAEKRKKQEAKRAKLKEQKEQAAAVEPEPMPPQAPEDPEPCPDPKPAEETTNSTILTEQQVQKITTAFRHFGIQTNVLEENLGKPRAEWNELDRRCLLQVFDDLKKGIIEPSSLLDDSSSG